MRAAVLACLSIGLTGCAGTDTHLRMMEHDGAFQIDPTPTKTYDYTARIKNLLDFGFDADVLQDRNDAALRGIRAQCPRAKIVGEEVFERGSSALGRPLREYFIHLKC